MKKLLALLCLLPVLAFGAETKEVCNMQKDKKGKEVKVCKKIKVHEKLEGTKVPGK